MWAHLESINMVYLFIRRTWWQPVKESFLDHLVHDGRGDFPKVGVVHNAPGALRAWDDMKVLGVVFLTPRHPL